MCSLNLNCQNLIISYLVSLPKLPFLKELIQETRHIKDDLHNCIYYQSGFTIKHNISGYSTHYQNECRIYHNGAYLKAWRVGYTYNIK